jgi:hypothetical protein
LKPQYEETLSNSAFELNLRLYILNDLRRRLETDHKAGKRIFFAVSLWAGWR